MNTAEPVRGEMAILDKTGDTKLIWSTDKTDEVENAPGRGCLSHLAL
jgi:hypothetical protein